MVSKLIKKLGMGIPFAIAVTLGTPKIAYESPVNYSNEDSAPVVEKLYRDITHNFKSTGARKLHDEIVSYAGKTDTLWVPEYSLRDVAPTNCAKYVRTATKDIFDIDYNYDEDVLPRKRGAWNYRYYNKIVNSSDEGFDKDEIITQINNKDLQPGMIAGIYNPTSHYNNWKDKNGERVKYTHLAVFLGLDESGNPIFANQLGKKTKVVSLDYFLEKGWKVKEILDVPDKLLSQNKI